MTKYNKYKSDGLWSIKWMRWAMVDDMNMINYGRWNEWDGLWFVNTTTMEWWWDNATTCTQLRWSANKMAEQDGYT